MECVKKRLFSDGSTLWVYAITYGEKKLKEGVDLTQKEKEKLASIVVEEKRKEFMSSRYILQHCIGKTERIIYSEYGAPKLESGKGNISISHSKGRVAVLFHPSKKVGVDIQKEDKRMSRLAFKFMNEKEKAYISTVSEDNAYWQYHVLWCAKEAMFKWIEVGNVDFKEHLFIKPFSWNNEQRIYANVNCDTIQTTLQLYYEKIEDFIVVTTIYG